MPLTLDQWYADQQKYTEMTDPGRQGHVRDEELNEQRDLESAGRGPDKIFHPQTSEDYNKIPMGGTYVDPGDGKIYKKGVNDLPPKGVEA